MSVPVFYKMSTFNLLKITHDISIYMYKNSSRLVPNYGKLHNLQTYHINNLTGKNKRLL